ncbi:MAG TPA: ABC transporter permease subunit [Anaerolineales bacterium]|nr:ABC transporter permease subunit [Anaerolineales bacterium]
MRKINLWAWLWIILGGLYFFGPLYGALDFSMREKRGILSFVAYENVLKDPNFRDSFTYSTLIALATITVGLILIVSTAYWVHLRLPQARPIVDFITLLPFVVPAIVLVDGFIQIYSGPPFALTDTPQGTNVLLMFGYIVTAMPYMYRSVDAGLRAVDVRTLTEAGQSLGAGWITILFRVILPNIRTALLSGAFLTFAIVIGEYTFASLLARPAFGPYMVLLGQDRAYEPAALSIMSFALTWAAMMLIQFLGRGAPGQGQVAGAH